MAVVFAILLLGLALCAGCGGFVLSSDGCLVAAVRIDPDSAVVVHTASPPANTFVFTAFETTTPNSCVVTSNVVFVTSDPSTATITNMAGQNSGTAMCLQSSPNPVTITATTTSNGKQMRSSATLICR
jgi:hypothetical protein